MAQSPNRIRLSGSLALGRYLGATAPARVGRASGTAPSRTLAEFALKSRWVIPQKVLDTGCMFARPTLERAPRAILAGRF